MSENETQGSDSSLLDSEKARAGLEKLRKKLGLSPAPSPVEGEQQPEQPPTTEAPPVPTLDPPAETSDGMMNEVDWSLFDLNPDLAHLYPKATLREVKGEQRWVVMLDVFEFDTLPYSKLGKRVTERVNGAERWRIATVYANGAGMGAVLFTRLAPMVLPDPIPLKTDADVPPPPTDSELEEAERKALDWVTREGQAQEESDPVIPEVNDSAQEVNDSFTIPVDSEPPVTDNTRVDLVSQALEINPPTERDPGNMGLHQNERPNLARSAAEEAAAALDGPDFGSVPEGKQE